MKWVLEVDREFEVSYKADGSSITLFKVEEGSEWNNGREVNFGVCSRNLEIKEGDCIFWTTAKESGILDALKHHQGNFAIQGELIAPNIQGNFEGVKVPEIRIFDVFNIDKQEYLLPNDRYTFLEDLGIGNDQHVPIGEVVNPKEVFNGDINKALEYADGDGMYSGYREGVVFKSLTNPNLSFKIISNKYLLKEK